jgi:hypothetical protein
MQTKGFFAVLQISKCFEAVNFFSANISYVLILPEWEVQEQQLHHAFQV